MTPEEKAIELINSFLKLDKIYFSFVTYTEYQFNLAKKSAIHCVNEMIDNLDSFIFEDSHTKTQIADDILFLNLVKISIGKYNYETYTT